MASVRVTGATELAKLSGRVRTARPELRRALLKGTRMAMRPLVDEVKAATDRLPSGLRDFTSNARYTIRQKTEGQTAGVRLVGTLPGHDLYSIDRGDVRHPVFGHPDRWVSQGVPPGFFSETVEAQREELQREVLRRLRAFNDQLTT